MSEPSPIFDQVASEHEHHHHARPGALSHLRDEAEQLLERAEHPFRHQRDLPSQPATTTQPDQQPQEATMTTTPADAAPDTQPAPATTPAASTPKPDLAQRIDDKLAEVASNVGGWFDEARNDVKAELGPIVDKAVKFEQHVENDKFIGGYLNANFAVPEHLVDVGLTILQKFVEAVSSSTPAVPAATPAA